MFEPLGPWNEAEVRLEFRRYYHEIGMTGMTQILYELIMAAQICAEIMKEEQDNEKSEDTGN